MHLRERRYRLHVLAFPRGISRADLGTGVRALSVERRGRWSLRLRAARKKHAFRLQASLANLRRPFRPCSVRLKGRRLKRRLWSYDRRDARAARPFQGEARHARGAPLRPPQARLGSPHVRPTPPRAGNPRRRQPAARRAAHQRRRRREPARARARRTTPAATSSSCRAPSQPSAEQAPDPRELRELIPARDPGRALDDWGRSQRIFDLVQPALDFYYRYWFRVESEGVENVPSEGGALLVSNHAGRPAARRADDHAGDPPRAPGAAAALHAGRALVQGLPGRRPAHEQDGRGARPPRERPAPARRRAAPGAGVPRGDEGQPQALLAALQAAALRPGRLRAHRHARRGADRPDRGGRRRGRDADLRARPVHAAPDRASSTSR